MYDGSHGGPDERGNEGGDGETLRETLLAHSDHRAVRAVFGAHRTEAAVEPADLIETMRATDGAVAARGFDGAAERYVRWSGDRFELLSVWPPHTVTNYEHADADGAREALTGTESPRAVTLDETPFGSAPFPLTSRIGPL
jgi:hypothetical protein